jgi:hypothetical protein
MTIATAAALLLAVVVTATALMPLPLTASTYGCPLPPGATGENGTCFDCHQDWGAAPRDGGLAIEGVPETFEPGHEYDLRIALARGTGPQPFYAFAYAFELRTTGGNLTPLDPQTTVGRGPLEVASTLVSNATEWRLVWTAPATDEDVRFFAGAVVGDGDGTAAGDIPYMAWARAYGPLDVPPEDAPVPVVGMAAALLATVLVVAVVGYLLAFPRERPEPPRDDDEEGAEGMGRGGP